MTDRARELLERALKNLCGAKLCHINSMSSRLEMVRLMDESIEEIRTYLAEPEVKRGPLDEEDIIEAFDSSDACGIMDNFIAGVRFAEKHHGIGGWDE